MESPIGGYPANRSLPFSRKSRSSDVLEWNSVGYKRAKVCSEAKDCNGMGISQNISSGTPEQLCGDASKVIDYSDPFGISKFLDSLEGGDFGSVTKEIQEIRAKRMEFLNPFYVLHPELANMGLNEGKSQMEKASTMINLAGDDVVNNSQVPVVIIDSDDENGADEMPSQPHQLSSNPYLLPPNPFQLPPLPYQQPSFQEIFLGRPASKYPENDIMGKSKGRRSEEQNMAGKMGNGKGVYIGVDNDVEEQNEKNEEDDGLGDIWKEMSVALECSKDVAGDPSSEVDESEDEDCDHSFVLKDDLGYVCRICGVIQRGIDTIFDFQYVKVTRLNRNYKSDSHDMKDIDPSEILPNGLKLSQHDYTASGISAHPRHKKEMKPHQVEGFNFLVSNLVGDDPGGCILAHAPGSGKTFMIISFMQSFMAKYPHARPLVVLPKGILSIWKREFQKWQVEDIPLYDFYSVKAESRVQQLEVLKQWVEEKSLLFLGYKQFSSIVCGSHTNKIAAACEEILLKVPTILILDEGHTPRNENTDVLHSLAKVQTRRKVVLSGTLYQNHVKEVFNILNLVRPKFLKLDTSRTIVKRILSKVKISGIRKNLKAHADMAFYDLVEHTLQKEEDFRVKVTVIQDLREMTSKVLHYYKGDFLDELPGLEDFTVLLKVSAKQKSEVDKLKKRSEHKFKRSSVGSAIYMHPHLKHFSENIQNGDKLSSVNDAKMDEMLEKLDVRDGVKAKFFLNIIGLCESAGEKLLVFSQYLIPLKFLERLTMKEKGWIPGRETFMITGESNSDQRELAMDRFNNSADAKVFFGSIKACGEGISLVGASRIIILDVHLNPSVTRQAIGRAFRPGQKKKVYTYRLVAANSPEEEDHLTCFRKELISRMWFEWNEHCGHRDFDVETIEVDKCEDLFLETPLLQEDIKVLYKR